MSAIDRGLVAKGVPQAAGLTLTGSAQLVVAKNTVQRDIEIVNIGNANIGISFVTATPVIGNADTITIAAGGTWRNPTGFVPVADIYVIGSAAQKITAWYY